MADKVVYILNGPVSLHVRSQRRRIQVGEEVTLTREEAKEYRDAGFDLTKPSARASKSDSDGEKKD